LSRKIFQKKVDMKKFSILLILPILTAGGEIKTPETTKHTGLPYRIRTLSQEDGHFGLLHIVYPIGGILCSLADPTPGFAIHRCISEENTDIIAVESLSGYAVESGL
jgi:hypothetical protein